MYTINNPAQILKGGTTMKPMSRKLTADLPQIGTQVRIHLKGSGQLQQDMEAFDNGSFATMMAGVKSDATALVHGDFRQQLINFLTEHGSKGEEESAVEVSSVMADDSVRFEISVQLSFAWQLPAELRQNAATSLTAGCMQYATASASRARMIMAAALEHAGQTPRGGQQSISLASNALQQMLAQQMTEGEGHAASIVTQSSSTDSSLPGPGQYL